MKYLNKFLQQHEPSLLSRDLSGERGYTLQTLIIIAILVLGATVAFTFIYAILDDSTDNIVGGSESYRGIPGPPQNIEIIVGSIDDKGTMDDLSDDTVVLDIYWESPGYSGENQIVWDESTVELSGESCGPIEYKPPYMCQINFSLPLTIQDDRDAEHYAEYYDLVFKVMLAGEGSYPYPPISTRIRTGNSGILSPTEIQLLRSLAPVGVVEFDIESEVISNLIFLKLSIISNPCDDGTYDEVDSTIFTAYLSEVGGPQIVRQVEFKDCEKIIPIDSPPQGDAEYSIWVEAINSAGELHTSDIFTWNGTVGTPPPPRNLRLFPSNDLSVVIKWDEPNVNSGIEITDYLLSYYEILSDLPCDKPTTGRTLDQSETTRKPLATSRIPSWELIDLDSYDICLELVAVGNLVTEDGTLTPKPSSPIIVRLPEPYEIFRNIYSWVDVTTWEDKATLTWKANYPSIIANFDIVSLADDEANCQGSENSLVDGPFVLEPFAAGDTFSKTIDLRDEGTYICIITTYHDGSEHRLTYRDSSGNIPLRKGTNIEDLKLGNVGGNLNLTAAINRRYHTEETTYLVCLDFNYSGNDWITPAADTTISVTGSKTTYNSAGATITPSPNSHALEYQADTSIEVDQTYQVRAWTSSTDCGTYPSEGGYVEASYPES